MVSVSLSDSTRVGADESGEAGLSSSAMLFGQEVDFCRER